jgi:biotin carboxyl carrier protein
MGILPLFLAFPLSSKSSELVKIEKVEKKYKLELVARKFAQGEVIFVKIKAIKPGLIEENFKLLADGKEVILTDLDPDRIGFLPIGPERKPGPMILELQSKVLFVKTGVKRYQIEIGKTDFLVIKKQSLQIDKKYTDKKYTPEQLKFIEECTKAKNLAFASESPMQFRKGFANPVKTVYITSPFYVRRDYNNQKGRPHGGLDFRGQSGTPIYAIQDGTVVLAQPMYFEGNFTIIDHGNRIFSFYMHQSEIGVKVGDRVKKGDEIGKIGSTGMSTGPHLHLGVKINDTLVNPESVLFLKELGIPESK